MLFEGLCKKPPSLVDLCVRTAIDNVRYIGYVGGVDFQLLEQILQHCTLEHLMHIEDSTQDTDLSPVTNKFWKRFYEKQFGEKNFNFVIENMKEKKVNFKWRQLYEAKMQVAEEDEKKAVDKLKQRYKNEDARKQSRQTKLCSKAPPSKRPFWGNSVSGYNVSNVKSNIMKKARLEVLKSQEVKNLTAMKRNAIQKSFSISAPKRSSLSASAPSTSRRNNPVISAPKRMGLSANAPSISRSNNPVLSSISPPKRTGLLSANAPSTSRSFPSGERKLPLNRINSLSSTAPSTSRNAPTRQKHAM